MQWSLTASNFSGLSCKGLPSHMLPGFSSSLKTENPWPLRSYIFQPLKPIPHGRHSTFSCQVGVDPESHNRNSSRFCLLWLSRFRTFLRPFPFPKLEAQLGGVLPWGHLSFVPIKITSLLEGANFLNLSSSASLLYNAKLFNALFLSKLYSFISFWSTCLFFLLQISISITKSSTTDSRLPCLNISPAKESSPSLESLASGKYWEPRLKAARSLFARLSQEQPLVPLSVLFPSEMPWAGPP